MVTMERRTVVYRIARNIYADSVEECEIKLEALIKELRAEYGIR